MLDDLPVLNSAFKSTFDALQQLLAWGVLFFAVESKKPRYKLPPLKRDFFVDAAYPFFNIWVKVSVGVVLTAWMTVGFEEIGAPTRLFAEELKQVPFLLRLVLAMLFLDFIVYVEHRVEHRFLWPFHSVHHSTPDVTWITAGRVHPVNYLSILFFNFLFLYLIGFDQVILVIAGTLTSMAAMYCHANIDLSFKGRWRYLFISPQFHHWHHAMEKEGHDKNFCLLFPFIDKIFGTFYCPEGEWPKAYGLEASPRYGKVPDGFFAQLWYPFAAFFKKP